MPRVFGQSPLEVSFAVDQHVVQALAPWCSPIPLRKRVRPAEAVSFVMSQKMLRGIRDRAEQVA